MTQLLSLHTRGCGSVRCSAQGGTETRVIDMASRSHLGSPDAQPYLLYLVRLVLLITWVPRQLAAESRRS